MLAHVAGGGIKVASGSDDIAGSGDDIAGSGGEVARANGKGAGHGVAGTIDAVGFGSEVAVSAVAYDAVDVAGGEDDAGASCGFYGDGIGAGSGKAKEVDFGGGGNDDGAVASKGASEGEDGLTSFVAGGGVGNGKGVGAGAAYCDGTVAGDGFGSQGIVLVELVAPGVGVFRNGLLFEAQKRIVS